MAAVNLATNLQPKRMQNSLLIWADGSVRDDDTDTKKTLENFRSLTNNVIVVKRKNQCIHLLKDFETTRCFVVSSGALGQILVPEIHGMSNLESIYIFCGSKTFHQEWTRDWNKVKGVYSEIEALCQALELGEKQSNPDASQISLFKIRKTNADGRLHCLKPSFINTKLLRDTLLTMEHQKDKVEKFVEFSRYKFHDDPKELELINEFSRQYNAKRAIWWYTRECFIYQMLNRALRSSEGNIIVEMGFFLADLHQQLEKLHTEQINQYANQPFNVFRGQGLTEHELTEIKRSEEGLLGFSCFLSTSKDRTLALKYAKQRVNREDQIGVLFKITVDPKLTSTPFADIEKMNFFEESEVLFSTHSVFQIGTVKPVEKCHRLYEIDLSLIGYDDPRLNNIFDDQTKKFNGTGWYRVAWILTEMKQMPKAEEIFSDLLKTADNQQAKALYNHQLGWVNDRLGNYSIALKFYETALNIYSETNSDQQVELAKTYMGIGLVHKHLGDYQSALSYYEESFKMRQTKVEDNDSSLANYYYNMACVYRNMNNHPKSLILFEKARHIWELSLSSTDPQLIKIKRMIETVKKEM